MPRYHFVVVVAVILAVFARPTAAAPTAVTEPVGGNSIEEDCAVDKSCLKAKLFAVVDKALNRDEISLAKGVALVRNTALMDGAPRALDIAKADMMALAWNRAERFLATRSLKVDLRGADVLTVVTRAGRTLENMTEELEEGEEGLTEEARKKKKKGGKKAAKILGPLLMMLKMKMMGLIPIAFAIIALMAGKALILGKIALLLSFVLGLKKLLSHHHHKAVTYEVITHPHHDHGHDAYASGGGGGGGDYGGTGYGGGGSGHSGWGRSSDAAHNMAYNSYNKAA